MILHKRIGKVISSIKGEDFILDERIPISYLFSTLFLKVSKGYLSLQHPKSNVLQRFKWGII